MSNPSEELQIAYEFAIGAVIDCARKVVIFDGTERNSLDDLRSALLNLGAINQKIQELFNNGNQS